MAFVRKSVRVSAATFHVCSTPSHRRYSVNSVKCPPYQEDVQNQGPNPVTSRPHHTGKNVNFTNLCQLHISSTPGRILMKLQCKTHGQAVSCVLVEGQWVVFLQYRHSLRINIERLLCFFLHRHWELHLEIFVCVIHENELVLPC